MNYTLINIGNRKINKQQSVKQVRTKGELWTLNLKL
jgi:hypothetical protein